MVPTAGPERGRIRRFLTGVPGGEAAGPEFSPDYRALFLSIQHPGEGSGLENPTSCFPRPSVVVARKDDGARSVPNTTVLSCRPQAPVAQGIEHWPPEPGA